MHEEDSDQLAKAGFALKHPTADQMCYIYLEKKNDSLHTDRQSSGS